MNHTQAVLFLTGATGFLATHTARQLLCLPNLSLIALVRAADDQAAFERLRREWWDQADLRSALEMDTAPQDAFAPGQRVRVLAGDLTQPRFGLHASSYHSLVQTVTHILHAAADIRLFAPLDELRAINVVGTQHVLDFARAVHADHGLTRLSHVSTAYVAGARRGPIAEDELDPRGPFLSPYEHSKAEAEALVRQAASSFPVSIFRPGMITGDSRDGAIKTFNTLYLPLRLYLTGRISVSPARPDARVNLVPVDYVASALSALTFDPRAAGCTFHLTPPVEACPTQAEMAEFCRVWIHNELGIRLPKARFIPLPAGKGSSWLYRRLAGKALSHLTELLPYFQHQAQFRRDNSDALLGPYPHRWQDLLPPLLAYAVRYSFWQRSSRTVHEQIFHRLGSRTRPIRYHDLSAGKTDHRPGVEIRAEILSLLKAFRAMGLNPGDRVAIAGLNHTRYLSIIVAAGLSGLVLVPFYATAAPVEIDTLLKDSRPHCFFVGAPDILASLDAISFTGPVISFMDKTPAAGLPKRTVRSWDDFLSAGSAHPPPILKPISLDAPAALYYTSGTTGRPKGILYRHDQLRWLGETLASMYPWRERNRWGAYLSYLPVNHVVEGILAMFSPYYVPAALDIYFLNDFSALPQALRLARPTIFFSVPRFFEKVRALLAANPLAHLREKLPDNSLRRALTTLLRRGLLRRTGLDRCRQIIVGSATSSPDMLDFFAELGIEIHNAYGLTEAPLVTLNRLGQNRRDTLGEALPETGLRIAPDGEIFVCGPQVSHTALNPQAPPADMQDWLPTGDLGDLDPDGYLILHGRKKDLIITAYGKKVFPAPLECYLRSIPGVAEALLVGDNRSHLSALLWLEEGASAPGRLPILRAKIQALNVRLSHADRVKRWAVLVQPLNVLDGSLTGSLKLKRDIITTRFQTLIDALYNGDPPPPGVIFEYVLRPGD